MIDFLKKELLEFIRTPKLIILGALFVFFSIIGPLTAKYMNELIAAFASDIDVSFPDPTYVQSWEQFYSNMTSIVLIVLIIMVAGIVSGEKAKGSIYLVLTKRLTRRGFILAKCIASFMLFTLLYGVALLIHIYYTHVLFDRVFYEGVWLSIVSIYMLGIFFTSFSILMSILVKSTTHAALLAFFAYAVFNILTLLSDFNAYNPMGALPIALDHLMGKEVLSSPGVNLVVLLAATVAVVWVGLRAFDRQEL